MSIADATLDTPPRKRPLAQNGALGMAIVIFTEIMLFSGFISAFVIVRGTALPGMWPPAGQPRLPFERTMLNTAALLASGIVLWIGGRKFRKAGGPAAMRWLDAALLLGTVFVFAQGAEWIGLLKQGLTLTSSQLGSFFYVIVGAHALHAVAAIIALGWSAVLLRRGTLTESRLGAVELFWYFVVLMWPILYAIVYR